MSDIDDQQRRVPCAPIGAASPRRSAEIGKLRAVIDDLYSVIASLDSLQQWDFAGRLHALTLELRERVATEERREHSMRLL